MNAIHHGPPPFDWRTLPRPFSVLAPMEFVTDSAFRRLVLFCGPPDVSFSEFTHVDKLCCTDGQDTRNRLVYHPEERPLVAQIWGNHPDHTYAAVKTLMGLGFDGIDLNMGCAVPRVVEKGCGAALIKNPILARELILAAKEAAGLGVPVSVKTRLGFDRFDTERWTEHLLNVNPAALTFHGRTAVQRFRHSACWKEIGKVVALRNAMNSDTVIIGNGDVRSLAESLEKARRYGVEGVMAGRAVIKNPFFFREDGQSIESLVPAQRLQLLWRHATLCRESHGEALGHTVLKKYFKIYAMGFQGAAEFRNQLMRTRSLEDVYLLLKPYLETGPPFRTPF